MSQRATGSATPRAIDGRMLLLVVLGYGGFGLAFSQFGMPALFVENPREYVRPGAASVTKSVQDLPVEPIADPESPAAAESNSDNAAPAESPLSVPPEPLQEISAGKTNAGMAQSAMPENQAVVLAPITLGALPADVLGVPGPITTEEEESQPPVPDPPVEASPVVRIESVAITPRGQGDDTLLAAVESGDLQRVEALLYDRAANANALSSDGDSALMRAAWQGHSQVVNALIDAGADADYRSPRGISPLISAGIRGFGDIALALLEAGANIDAASNDGRTALMAAAWNGHDAVVQVLLGRGASVAETDRLGRSALHYAAAARRTDVAAYLLAAGANPDLPDHSGSTGRELAQARGWELGGSTQ